MRPSSGSTPQSFTLGGEATGTSTLPQQHEAERIARHTHQENRRREQRETNAFEDRARDRKAGKTSVSESDNVSSRVLPEDGPSFSDVVEAHLRHISTTSLETDSDQPTVAMAFQEMVYLRFGCTVTQDKVDTTLELPPTSLAQKLLGDPSIEISNSAAEWDNFRLFLAHCKQATSLFEIPASLYDFHQKGSALYSRWNVEVRKKVLNDQLYYVISEKEEQPHSLSILVCSATTVLQIVRQGWGPSLIIVMKNLLCRGINFLTCRSMKKISAHPNIQSTRPGYSGLGYRPPKFKPDLSDYNTYVAIRGRFMCSPRGRAALLYGGVIGRIARAEVSLEAVFRGPNDNVLADGICLWDGHSTSAYWDDCLTEEETDLICGIYHVATGQRLGQPNEQITTLSWWPKPSAFNASGLNVGWWTPAWETWYQKRLQQLENGSAVLCTHAQWKHNVKFERKVQPYTEGVEKCAAEVLAVLRP
ncbi:hypothetical protein DFH06DRAFT_497154 [Mycena polygramma]|nr:hypothetical protein DFH06DRAFT_497154 [Mycena polygramma]